MLSGEEKRGTIDEWTVGLFDARHLVAPSGGPYTIFAGAKDSLPVRNFAGMAMEVIMKGNRMYMDIGSIMDEVFEAAKDFGEKMKHFDPSEMPKCEPKFTSTWFDSGTEENTDYYPNYSYPPMNIYMTPDRSIVFEFALAGFDEKDISLTFQGDYMVFAARIGITEQTEEGVKYFKRRLKLKDVDKQKYYVPADKFDQEKVRAVFRNGILKITVPPKEDSESGDGIKIEIVREGK